MSRSVRALHPETPALLHELGGLQRATADTLALLFRLDPTPERLTAWADAYALLPEGTNR